MLKGFSALVCFSVALGAVHAQTDLLPDITIWRDKLNDNSIDTTTQSGRVLLRLSTGTPNLGPGRLELRGGAVVSGGQIVRQRIYRTDNTFWERDAGIFTYHPGHSHIHFDRWCVYRLRAVTTGNGVGEIIRTGQKTSFCVLDLTVHNTSAPGYRSPGFFSGCGNQVQGLTPGWADIYSKNLTDQWIDITGVPAGTYWLEAEVDPDGLLMEVNETNNVDRVLVTIGSTGGGGTTILPDAFEDNDSITITNNRVEGANNSPNLGVVNAERIISNLTLEDGGDFYRFRLNRTGATGDFVRISSTVTGSDMDLQLLNAAGSVLGSSTSSSNNEQISLNGRPAGVYYLRVFPFRGQVSNYSLTIRPSGNQPPSITVSLPNASGVWIERSYATVPLAWTATDPEGDPTTVALTMARKPIMNKRALPVEGYQNLLGAAGSANLNTAEMALGTWFLHFTVSDGGAQNGAWAPGTFVLYVKGDLDFDGWVTEADEAAMGKYLATNTRPLGWEYIMDIDRDGDTDADDYDMVHDLVKGHQH